MPKQDNIPTFDELIIPTIKALKLLGGSGTVPEINEKVGQLIEAKDLILQDDELQKFKKRITWTRTYLNKYNLIDNSSHGVWSLVNTGIDIQSIDTSDIFKTVRKLLRSNKQAKKELKALSKDTIEVLNSEGNDDWKELLLKTILNISPDAFERLTQRLLRENGFTQVEVTGKAGDGGIDGKGIVKLNDFLSFHVIFQCKRYQHSITPNQIRDFRGAMQGRTDKGIFITTSTFTRAAVKEATRDGAPPIELIDGDLLCEKLKNSQLGVETHMIEQVDIKKEWFDKL
ncbi:restriction endonuclease [Candidatus Albibeggiatoa sp. nov. NOAA]|uniref:restriction endonuclease n=1 Tax=Candidatus Albibeggiatoa sp. nov. NOAA TaxID=3162724 RepID=UPI0032F0B119|nr:restriction endonuclease [Thiotrichaceae bacterium]